MGLDSADWHFMMIRIISVCNDIDIFLIIARYTLYKVLLISTITFIDYIYTFQVGKAYRTCSVDPSYNVPVREVGKHINSSRINSGSKASNPTKYA